ncbi:hypothetical protein L0244_28490 [bacterium]|nr:hypothetical protein [bacterium]MCI0697354.1 hypothetical protein [candidate division KSB1 bacterium]
MKLLKELGREKAEKSSWQETNGGANTVSGRGDGGMIFNSNDLEVAPPLKQALAFADHLKERWLTGK